MKHFPGAKVEEILSLSAAIVAECSNKEDYIAYANRIADFADDYIIESGDTYMESEGYSLSTVRNCAVTIAEMLYYKGFVDIS